MKNLTIGKSYRFVVRALNFNGESGDSDEEIFYSCLPPTNMAAPTYISSTTTSLTIRWAPPKQLNGCPLIYYKVYRNPGNSTVLPAIAIGTYEPNVYESVVTLLVSDKSNTFKFMVEAYN